MKNLFCSLNGHSLIVVKAITHHVKEYECKHCKEKFTTSSQGHIIALTQKRKEINSILERVHLKKRHRNTCFK